MGMEVVDWISRTLSPVWLSGEHFFRALYTWRENTYYFLIMLDTWREHMLFSNLGLGGSSETHAGVNGKQMGSTGQNWTYYRALFKNNQYANNTLVCVMVMPGMVPPSPWAAPPLLLSNVPAQITVLVRINNMHEAPRRNKHCFIGGRSSPKS